MRSATNSPAKPCWARKERSRGSSLRNVRPDGSARPRALPSRRLARAASGTARTGDRPGPLSAPRARRKGGRAASAKSDSETAGTKGAESLSAAEVEAAVSRWGDTVLRLARSRMGNAADAEDVFQTVFLRLFQSGARFADDEHAKAWLLRVTANCCNDAHRAPWRRRRSAIDEDALSSIPAPEGSGEEDERLDRLDAALARLSGKQRAAVHLHYFEGYSTDEVAKITGERPATVRSHLHRARKALRIELGGRS